MDRGRVMSAAQKQHWQAKIKTHSLTRIGENVRKIVHLWGNHDIAKVSEINSRGLFFFTVFNALDQRARFGGLVRCVSRKALPSSRRVD
jgi:hypothetical protein